MTCREGFLKKTQQQTNNPNKTKYRWFCPPWVMESPFPSLSSCEILLPTDRLMQVIMAIKKELVIYLEERPKEPPPCLSKRLSSLIQSILGKPKLNVPITCLLCWVTVHHRDSVGTIPPKNLIWFRLSEVRLLLSEVCLPCCKDNNNFKHNLTF